MSTVRLRPTFSIPIAAPPGDVMNQVREEIQAKADEFEHQFVNRHAMISIVESKRHFWSPWLHLDIREMDGDAQEQHVFGRFSPHPSIWTGFVFSYLSIVVMLFFAGVTGLSQQLAGLSPWGYAIVPVLIVIAVLLWLFSQVGQRLADDEMRMMKQVIENAVQAANQGRSDQDQ